MIWGYGVPWFGTFLTRDEDPLYAKLKFLLEFDLKCTGVGLDEVAKMGDSDRERLGAYLEEHDLLLTPRIWYDYLHTDPDEAKRLTDEFIGNMQKCNKLLRACSVMTMVGRPWHRFERTMPLEEKIERLSAALAPLAAAAEDLGTPLGINNQGDYYCSDFVELCKRTPHLKIFLDTANTYWVGERPLPAFKEAAPYVVGTHWRDEFALPGQTKPQRFELVGCPTGDGDVPLRECYDLLLEHAPDPDRMVMEIEMIRPKGMDDYECLEKSLKSVRSLGEKK